MRYYRALRRIPIDASPFVSWGAESLPSLNWLLTGEAGNLCLIISIEVLLLMHMMW
jgi:hypothetical protein